MEKKEHSTHSKVVEVKENTKLTRPVMLSHLDLVEAGAHFGHKTKDWHPKTFKYLYGTHNKIHIINLRKTIQMWPELREIIVNTVANGMNILFVGTKKQASDIVQREATYCEQPYVVNKWKGGTLTNLKTIRKRIARMEYLENLLNDPEKTKRYVKKELLNLDKEYKKLSESFNGIRNMDCYPGMVFVIDVIREKTAVAEARKLGLPVIGLLDSNCDPDTLDYFLPSNDDAIKTIDLMTRAVAEAVMDGKRLLTGETQTGTEAEIANLVQI